MSGVYNGPLLCGFDVPLKGQTRCFTVLTVKAWDEDSSNADVNYKVAQNAMSLFWLLTSLKCYKPIFLISKINKTWINSNSDLFIYLCFIYVYLCMYLFI